MCRDSARPGWIAAYLLLLLTLATAPARAGGPLSSGETISGTLTAPGYTESWTFAGSTNDRVLISAVTTGGAVNTLIRLKDPGGTDVVVTTNDRVDYQLQATGTYTLVIEDSGLNDAGTYNASLLNVTAGPLTSGSDADGGPIGSAEVATGSHGLVGDFDAFTFEGTSGDRVLFGGLATTGGSYNTNIVLYPPGGGSPVYNSGTGDRMDVQLGQTGTYTVVMEDYSLDHTGSYSVSLLNVTAGPLTSGSDGDGGTIASAEVWTASLGSTPDFDAWRFTGTNGDRVLIGAVATGAGGHDTVLYLYPPGGGNPVVSSSNDRTDYRLQATGTYTIVIEDSGLNNAGAFNLSLLNVTAGPLTSGSDPDGGPIGSAEVATGTHGLVGDFDAFTFEGTSGDRVLFGGLATTGGSYNTNIVLYPPGGGSPVYNSGTGDRMDVQLGQTGTYTVVMEDYSLDHTGSYSVSLLNVTAGPLTSGTDGDGGTIASAEVWTASLGSTPDFDAWRFTGTNGDRVLIGAVATGAGGHDTVLYLYPPGGGNPVVSSSNDRTDYRLQATGTYTIVIEDSGLNNAGAFNLSLLNVTAGPLTSGSDPDGGPIGSAEVATGTHGLVGDFDAFTFEGTSGDRVLFGGLATTGGSYNTNIVLYPPGGGSPVYNSGTGDRMDVQLGQTGTYTVVMEDYLLDHTGSYSVSLLNVTAGPLTSGTDGDGGTIASAEVLTASLGSTPDFDAWRFTGTNGDRVLIGAVATGAGGHDTVLYLYPPGGGNPVVSSSNDRTDYRLQATGTYAIVIEDVGLDHTGAFNLSLLNVTAGPLTSGSDPDGGPIGSAEVATGTHGLVGDFDAFTFEGTSGDRVLFGGLATTGGSYNTNIVLYPPGGGSPVYNSGTGDRMDVQLGQTGTYTVVMEDYLLDHTGSYSVSLLNVTAGPLTSGTDGDGGTIASAEVLTASLGSTPDFDAWRFTGTNGDRVLIGAVATGAGGHDTVLYLYPPGGGNPVVSSGNDRTDYQLQATGTYTIVIEDSGLNNAGAFNLSLLNVTAGPLTSGSDPDGGPIGSAEVATGSHGVVGDFDAFTFEGTSGDRVLFGGLATTGGSYNTNIVLYPPGGGSPVYNSGTGDRMDVQLGQTGTYTVVMEDYSLDHTGSYSVTLANLMAGPFVTEADPDGGRMGSGESRSGTISPAPDFDIFPFTSVAGDTIEIAAVATSGAINTQISIYPPNGPAVVSTANDNVTYVLPADGTYALVIEDSGINDTGTYNLSFVATAFVSDAPDLSGDEGFDSSRVVLRTPYPNPSSGAAQVTFSLPADSRAAVAIYDARGALVRALVDADLAAGNHALEWDGRDDAGRETACGIYYLALRAGGESFQKKLVRVR